jgi:hypothetical protein
MTNLRAITVCVDYSDTLSITLPYNRHHYSEYWIITTDRDVLTHVLGEQYGCKILTTDSFYSNGAYFNKWKALEEGLTMMGRHGWINVLDADIMLPKEAKFGFLSDHNQQILFAPLRRMYEATFKVGQDLYVPNERDWIRYPYHRNIREWAGYCQIFHANAPSLGPPPWYEQDWVHAGGADSFFQEKFSMKIRPDWDCLHIGTPGVNWFGRTTKDKELLYNRLWKERTRGGRPSKIPL